MNPKNSSPLVPSLRFPEFREAGEWEEKSLGETGELKNGINFSADKKGSGILTVDVLNMYSFGIETKLDSLYRVNVDIKDYLLKNGDILFVRSSVKREGVGWSSLFKGFSEPVLFCGFLIRLRLKSLRLTHPEFLLYYLRSDFGRQKIISVSGTAVITNISQDSLKTINIPFPTLEEQQKIAACLSSLDELITAHSKKLDALKKHKKGLMQQLFPAEGQTVPSLRFPEFSEAGEWVEKLIEDFFLVGSSKRVLQENWTTQGVPFYRTRELVSLNKNEPFSSEIFISEELFCEIAKKYGLPAEGDFLVSGVGTLGISYQVKAGDRFYFKDGNVLWLKLKSSIVSTFFKYCFQSDGIQNQILGQACISTVGTYTIQNAKTTKFFYPPKIAEQQKIAACLSSLDELITAHSKKLDALKKHKKGLMQQLFPVVGED